MNLCLIFGDVPVAPIDTLPIWILSVVKCFIERGLEFSELHITWVNGIVLAGCSL